MIGFSAGVLIEGSLRFRFHVSGIGVSGLVYWFGLMYTDSTEATFLRLQLVARLTFLENNRFQGSLARLNEAVLTLDLVKGPSPVNNQLAGRLVKHSGAVVCGGLRRWKS